MIQSLSKLRDAGIRTQRLAYLHVHVNAKPSSGDIFGQCAEPDAAGMTCMQLPQGEGGRLRGRGEKAVLVLLNIPLAHVVHELGSDGIRIERRQITNWKREFSRM